jgi:D-serine dehydratase
MGRKVMPELDLAPIKNSFLDDNIKGIPGGVSAFPLREIGAKGWNVLREDLPLPLAILKDSALSHNAEWMRRFTEMTGTLLCPHGKTSMSPQLFDRQLRAGAWGITAATVGQVQVMRRHRVGRIFLANQLVGRQNIRYIAEELQRDPEFDFYCLVDSAAGVQSLVSSLDDVALRRPLQVLLEVGQSGGRAGVRTREQALDVARAVHKSRALALRGVEGYEGILAGSDAADMDRRIELLMNEMRNALCLLAQERLFAPGSILLSAGGSAYFDFPASRWRDLGIDENVEIVLRSGCYLTHDSHWLEQLHEGIRERMPQICQLGVGLQPALEIWAYVQSVPESGLLIATVGKRDCSYDIELPRVTQWHRPGESDAPRPLSNGYRVLKLNDQHAYVQVPPGSPLRVGDMLTFGISHPCTTFDKWSLLPVVNDRYDVVDAVRTFF